MGGNLASTAFLQGRSVSTFLFKESDAKASSDESGTHSPTHLLTYLFTHSLTFLLTHSLKTMMMSVTWIPQLMTSSVTRMRTAITRCSCPHPSHFGPCQSWPRLVTRVSPPGALAWMWWKGLRTSTRQRVGG